MSHTFVIAECGSSHDNDLQKAYRLVEAAKECGADAAKFQFWSNSKALADRRKLGKDAEAVYAKYKLPQGWLPILANLCEKKGLEFMCTAFLHEDIPTVAPYVSRFKVSAFESKWGGEFEPYIPYRKQIIASTNGGHSLHTLKHVSWLHCISNYPTKLEDVRLNTIRHNCDYSGFSDHTANVLTGAAAVAAGARIVEAHIRLHDTDPSNPDYGHSLVANCYGWLLSDPGKGPPIPSSPIPFAEYVRNIRTVERML